MLVPPAALAPAAAAAITPPRPPVRITQPWDTNWPAASYARERSSDEAPSPGPEIATYFMGPCTSATVRSRFEPTQPGLRSRDERLGQTLGREQQQSVLLGRIGVVGLRHRGMGPPRLRQDAG